MVNNLDPTKHRILELGLKVVGPDSVPDPGPDERLIENGVPIRFTVAQHDWLIEVTGAARLDKTGKRIELDKSAIVREAVRRLAVSGGWDQLRDDLWEA